MANDRVYIVCKSCGSWKMFLKHFAGNMSTRPEFKVLRWIDEHCKCHPNLNRNDLGGDPGFYMVTESSEEFRHLDSGGNNRLPDGSVMEY